MNVLLERLIAYCKEDREALIQQVEMIESGNMQTHVKTHDGLVDTTQTALATAKRKIKELDDLIARHPDVA